MDSKTAVIGAKHDHASMLRSENASACLLTDAFAAAAKKVFVGKKLYKKDFNQIVHAVESVDPRSVVGKVIDVDDKTLNANLIRFTPGSSQMGLFYAGSTATVIASRKSVTVVSRSLPIHVSSHVVERYAVRASQTPGAFLNGDGLADATLFSVGMTFAADNTSNVRQRIVAPHRDGLILGYMGKDDFAGTHNSATKISRQLTHTSRVDNAAVKRGLNTTWLTFIDHDSLFERQERLLSVIRRYMETYRNGLVALITDLFLGTQAEAAGLISPDSDAAILALRDLMGSSDWTP